MNRIWISQRLKRLGKKKKDLAKALSLPHSRISDILNERRSLKLTEIEVFALFMRMEVSDVITMFNKNEGITFEYRYLPRDPEWNYYLFPGQTHYAGLEDDIKRDLAKGFAENSFDEDEVSSIMNDVEVRLKK